MISYANKNLEYKGCPGCAYANHEFELPCGIAFENERFNLSQDWELPIPAFFILSPKRHVERFSELEVNEKIEMFEIVDETIKVLRENDICDTFDVIFEEKLNRHFHIWILPRYQWMSERAGSIIANIGKIFEYAKSNMRTEENYENIKNITTLVKKYFEEKQS